MVVPRVVIVGNSPCSLSDRSFNDIMQYPVMPWVIADYTSQTLGRCCLFLYLHQDYGSTGFHSQNVYCYKSLSSTKNMVALHFLARISLVPRLLPMKKNYMGRSLGTKLARMSTVTAVHCLFLLHQNYGWTGLPNQNVLPSQVYTVCHYDVREKRLCWQVSIVKICNIYTLKNGMLRYTPGYCTSVT